MVAPCSSRSRGRRWSDCRQGRIGERSDADDDTDVLLMRPVDLGPACAWAGLSRQSPGADAGPQCRRIPLRSKTASSSRSQVHRALPRAYLAADVLRLSVNVRAWTRRGTQFVSQSGSLAWLGRPDGWAAVVSRYVPYARGLAPRGQSLQRWVLRPVRPGRSTLVMAGATAGP